MIIPLSYNMRNLRARKATSALTILGLALVVFVFVAVLMLARGLEEALVGTGSDDNVLAIRKGAGVEVSSGVDRNTSAVLRAQPEVVTGADGGTLATSEIVVLITQPKRSDGLTSNLTVRGVSANSLAMRPQVRLIWGRTWHPGTSEVIAGSSLARRFIGCGLGETLRFGMRDWTVVGVFDAEGSGFESEVWGDVDQLMPAFRRPVFSSVTMKLRDPSSFEAMKARVESDPRTIVTLYREKQYYADQSKYLATFIRVMGLAVTIIFSLGAMIGASITMYAAVSNRTPEIGTLRALGFSRWSIGLCFLVESTMLALGGGILGIAAGSLMQTVSISTTNWSTWSELAFRFALTSDIAVEGMIFALAMGLVGGFLPAVRASRLDLLQSLRAA
jgi:ABC-type lipoprotein release transport system permease subunit